MGSLYKIRRGYVSSSVLILATDAHPVKITTIQENISELTLYNAKFICEQTVVSQSKVSVLLYILHGLKITLTCWIRIAQAKYSLNCLDGDRLSPLPGTAV